MRCKLTMYIASYFLRNHPYVHAQLDPYLSYPRNKDTYTKDVEIFSTESMVILFSHHLMKVQCYYSAITKIQLVFSGKVNCKASVLWKLVKI